MSPFLPPLSSFFFVQEYIVRGNEVLIVDTFSGRVLEGRRYSDGLHQCIEAKEGGNGSEIIVSERVHRQHPWAPYIAA